MSDPRPPGDSRPRVGHIAFLNCLPLYWGLERTGALERLDLCTDSPDRLSDALVRGELDAGPISVVEYLRHADDLVVLPDLAIGSPGPVLSVNLVSRGPVADLDGRTVALCSTSRTSVLLAQLLLAERFGVDARFVDAEPDLDLMLADADAAVLIGDPALAAALGGAQQRGLQVLDLATAWREWTGLPMVFALWAARGEWVERDPAAVAELHRELVASRDLSLAHADAVAADAAGSPAGAEFSAAELTRYFASLDFSLGGPQLAGLREFALRVAGRAGTPRAPGIRLLAR
jgi:chorismate dehydratase